jgi:hypothetical protein
VSADCPAWIQIPRVTVNKLSSAQLANLVSWKAPLPIQHTQPEMLHMFFGVRDRPLTQAGGVRREQSRATASLTAAHTPMRPQEGFG